MKSILVYLSLVLFSAGSYADCPSIDQAIEKFNEGRATRLDVENAILCKYSNCDFKFLILTNRLTAVVELFNVGEKTKEDITFAATELAQAKSECAK